MVAYGGGVNSTALLVGLHNRGRRPDLILFADTGGEKPGTYAYLSRIDSWLESVGFPQVIRVSNDGMYRTLEAECLARATLPSLAFGWRSCSDKYKRRPQDKFLAGWGQAVAAWEQGKLVVKLIGIDAGEAHRAATAKDDSRYRYNFPLIEWEWGREECIAAITAAGLPVPPKSSCFFCPASRRQEVLELATDHPDLFARAVAMENGAKATLTAVKGLGRRYAWADVPGEGRASLPLLTDEPSLPCQCFDGE